MIRNIKENIKNNIQVYLLLAIATALFKIAFIGIYVEADVGGSITTDVNGYISTDTHISD